MLVVFVVVVIMLVVVSGVVTAVVVVVFFVVFVRAGALVATQVFITLVVAMPSGILVEILEVSR